MYNANLGDFMGVGRGQTRSAFEVGEILYTFPIQALNSLTHLNLLQIYNNYVLFNYFIYLLAKIFFKFGISKLNTIDPNC